MKTGAKTAISFLLKKQKKGGNNHLPVYKIRQTHALTGEVVVSESKNAVLPLLASALLTDEEVTLESVPQLSDVDNMIKILKLSGKNVQKIGKSVRVFGLSNNSEITHQEIVKSMRASVLVLGPLLVRHKRASIFLPGGCSIGLRPVDLHLKGLEKMGAVSNVENGKLVIEGNLQGTTIYLDFPSVGATENLLMASVLAEGETVIENAAKEPEVSNLVDMLLLMGAKIQGKGSNSLKIQGVKKLKGAHFVPIPDRIEAGTFLCACALTKGSLLIKNVKMEHLRAPIHKLLEVGMMIKEQEDGLFVSGQIQRPFEIRTLSYPGFPTDLQALFSVLALKPFGVSAIVETIFENRFMHLSELSRLGADIQVEGQLALIKGGKELSGATIKATDLRASAALLLAGLIAEGETVLKDDDAHLLRGYEQLEQKLQVLGANVQRIE